MPDPEAQPTGADSARPLGRRTFAPMVLLGLATAGLLAVGGTKPWVRPTGQDPATLVSPGLGSVGEVPLAGALGLVVLAAWGVLLVTRGRVRRAVALLAVLAAAGSVVTVVRGRSQAESALARELGVATVQATSTGWFWVSAVAAPVALLAAVVAVRFVPAWPAMGSRYDAPATRGATTSTSEPPTPTSTGLPPAADRDQQLDLWRALDQGRDPTA